ncbi:GPI ethanolamine phosphate transferase 2 [Drosophila tropicalis]|uniref:GPI ethanolamine phosphate transferase 2 n=1 Tax=Drosophila tropicalis TaxID=46794 RepID=UPI0035ABD68C
MDEHKSRLAYTFFMLTFFLCGSIIFLVGFYPASYSFSAEKENSIPSDRPKVLHGLKLEPPPPSYDSFILLVIDALREDFPNATTMPVAYERACEKLSLHVDIPTVTMPRLKSITTGTLSNFIDIALNVGHTEQLDDSLLHRLKKQNRFATFAGDHTWIQLFPSEFTRHRANNDSFYVNDFYDGDKRVTESLNLELKRTDWTLMVLHYLGLDHIGHVESHASPKIIPKLNEMDDVVKRIVEYKNLTNYLLMLTGDHGMADGGGHGGNTPQETAVPLYLYSKNCSQTKSSSKLRPYNQIDLTPTLSILLSVEIPTMSIGCLIPEMLQSLSKEQQLYAYFYNAHHLMNRARVRLGHDQVHNADYYGWYQEATQKHKQVILEETESSSLVNYETAKLNYMRVAEKISVLLSESLIKFDYGFIALGLGLTTTASIHLLLSVLFLDLTDQLQLNNVRALQLLISIGASLIFLVIGHLMDIIMTSSMLHSVLLIVPLSIAFYLGLDIVRALVKISLPPSSFPRLYSPRRLKLSLPLPKILFLCYAIRTFTLGSSSFIEYEYRTWYYLGNTLILLTALRTLRRRITKANVELDGRHLSKIASACLWQHRRIFVVLLLLILMRYAYRLHAIKSTLMIFSLFVLWARLRKFSQLPQSIVTAVGFAIIYAFRGLTGQVQFFDFSEFVASRLVVPTVLAFWICFALVLVLGYREAIPQTNPPSHWTKSFVLQQLMQTNLVCSLMVSALLYNVRNIVLLPTLLITLNETYKLCDAFATSSSSQKFSVRLVHVYKIMMTIFVARMFYFYQGNSNSLSTIDLTPGYIGQSSYNPVIVGLFVTIHTYCAEIHSFLYLIIHTLRTSDLRGVGIMQMQPAYSTATDSLVVPLYATLIILPVAFYLCLMVGFRYHLFIYSVFSPKVLYDCYMVLVFYMVFLITSLYLKLFKNYG